MFGKTQPIAENEIRQNSKFAVNWSVVKDWSEEARYQTQMPEKTARDIVAALTDPTDGVLTWLKKHW